MVSTHKSSKRSPPSSTTSSTRKKRTNRRQNAPTLPKLESEDDTVKAHNTTNMLTNYGLTENGKIDCSLEIQERAERYHVNQALIPHGSMSPCINATDRARRLRRSWIWRAKAEVPPISTLSSQVAVSETFCDMTPLLHDTPKPKSTSLRSKPESVANLIDEDHRSAGYGFEDDDEFPGMVLSDDEGDLSGDFEVVKYEPMSEHNGTVRKWYRGFRH